MGVSDLNSAQYLIAPAGLDLLWADEYRTACLCPIDESDSSRGFPSMRRSLPRSGTSSQVLLLGSIPVHGFRPTDLSRQSARYRRLFVRPQRPALSDGVSRSHSTQRFFVYLTNHFTLPPLTIALLYKSRWQVELFFKWIKQNLRIKSFFGTSPNAVKTQVWIAVCVYVLVAILKKELNLPGSLHQILQNLSVNAFEKVQIDQLLMKQLQDFPESENCNQLKLFNF